jgi:O-antigen ligase
MTEKKMSKNRNIESRPMQIILFSSFLITVYFNPALQDPFNSPKFWLLMIFGSWLCGYLLPGFNFKKINNILRTNLGLVSLCGFTLTLFISALMTDSKFIAFFGDSGRRIGFITYLFFAIYMFASYRFITFKYLPILYKTLIAIGLVLIIYGFMQSSGNDFVQWNNPYNSIISTFGNPNFASAAMAMFSVVCFSAIFVSQFSWILRILSLVFNVMLISLIASSDSRQGLVSYGVGVSFVIIVLVFSKSKKIGIVSLGAFAVIGLLTILGMLQIGPLEKYLYKSSVSVRGYYWRAGFEMLKNNPFAGVGLDRYGVYFKQYRDVGYPLNYGFDITSTNAHSIPIQLAATGGIFVGLFYLLLLVYIFNRGVFSLRNNVGDNRIFIAGVFAAWISYQAQSLISIENIGLGIWGWVLGGVLIGVAKLTRENDSNQNSGSAKIAKHNTNSNLTQPLISGVITFAAIILVSLLYSGDKATIETRQYFNNTNSAQSETFYAKADSAFKNSFTDPFYKLVISEMFVQSGDQNRAVEEITKLYVKDPKNLDYIRSLAMIAEKNNDNNTAIKFRKLIAEYDPWNADNFLLLGLNYKVIGEFTSMNTMLDKIVKIAPNHLIAETAKLQLRQ